MSKKSIYIIITVVVAFAALGGAWYYSQPRSNTDAIVKTANWDVNNADKIFSLQAPDDFDTFKLGILEEKKAAARNLYDTKKDDTWTWISIGNMYEYAHDYDRAILTYQYAASLNPGEYISRMNLAYIFENEKKDFATAEKYYKEVINLNYANPENYTNLARLYEFKIKNLAEAEKTYADGLVKSGNYPDLLVATIRFYQRQNNAAKVGETARLLLQLNPDNATYQEEFGLFLK
ncbi:MAG: hypothetical protein Q7S66_03510 [bacterium]|nr:hypothetical protein [bacterium]